MVRRIQVRPTWLLAAALVAAIAIALPAAAQSTGMIKGTVKDDKGQLVDSAKVTIVMSGGTGRRFETKTNKKGEFIQIGLTGGTYIVTVEKDKLAAAPTTVNVSVQTPADVAFVLTAGAGNTIAAGKGAAIRKLFEEGVALSQAGKHEEAIGKFTQAAEAMPNCNDCYNNVGFSYTQMKEWDKAEAAYKKSIELKAEDAAAYNGLATVYNAQRKFDLASEASTKATQLASAAGGASGGNADALYNQGVVAWNAGKVPDAKKAFEGAIQANPNHAEAHYQLGMALVNENNLSAAATEFEAYIKLSPEGANAATAKALLAQLKK